MLKAPKKSHDDVGNEGGEANAMELANPNL